MGDWKIVASAGTVVTSSVPDAPNVLDTVPNPTTVTVVYGMIGNASAYGFAWSISLPTTHPEYAHDKKIHVVRVRGSHLDELKTEYGPWSSSPLTGDSGAEPRWFQDDASHTDSVEFLCENDEGSITASPVSKSVTIAAAAVSACPAVDASTLSTSNSEYHARFQDLATALHTVINTHVSMANAQYPQTATLWINKQDGNGPLWQGWWKITGAAQLVQIGLPNSNTDVYPPGGASDGSWLMIAAAGAIPKEAGVPSSALTSSAFTVPTIPAPSPTAATGAWIDQIDYGNNGQVNTWGWKNLFTTLPYNDPNFFLGRWTVQNGSLSGSVFTPGTAENFAQHDGAEVAFTDDDNGGNGSTVLRMPGTNIVAVTNPLMWTLPAYRLGDGSLNPNSCFCFRNYVGSRRNTDGSGGTLTQQNDWSSGVGVSTPGTASQLYVVLDLTKALMHGRQLVADSVPASAISSVNASAIQGSIYASSIASVNASTITGAVNASNIGSVNASSITGTINASNIGSVNASTINGTIFASSIGSVNASVINGTLYASSIGSVNAGVINGSFYASSIASVNASTITGMLSASSIASVNASTINGTLYASSIGSVNASVINGTFYASSIGSVSAATITGVLYASSIGSVNASAVTGILYASSIGSVNASTISGTLVASSIGSVNASVINGSLYASSIASVSATTINGLIVTSQIATGIIDSLNKFASGLSMIQRVTSLPATTGLPDGALALLTVPTPARLYQIVTGAWTLVTASTAITGQLQATDIANIQASQINGLVLAAQISQINASQINGSIYASSIATVNASTINGSIYASSIASVNAAAIAVVNATAISGSLYASSIATVNASALKGSIYASSIASLSASVISGFIYASSISSVNATALTGSIYASSIASVNATTLTGTGYASSIASVNASSINVVAGAAGTINVGGGGLTFQGTGGISFSDGAGHSGSIVWQTLTAGYGVGVNTNFSVNGSVFSSGNYWCGSQVSANTLAIYNSGVGTLNVIDNNFIFVGRGVNCPDYGIACAGVNPKVGGTQKYGATFDLQYKDWSGTNQTAHINGGVVTTA